MDELDTTELKRAIEVRARRDGYVRPNGPNHGAVTGTGALSRRCRNLKPKSGSPPGIETDGYGQLIPLAEHTEEDQHAAHAAAGGNASIKNPEHEAENPAAMPADQQGQGGKMLHRDLEGQQGGTEGGGHELL